MLSIPDMAILGTAALMFFGPDKLPGVARKVGVFMRDIQNTSQDFIREMERAAEEPAGDGVARGHLLDNLSGNGSYATYDPVRSTQTEEHATVAGEPKRGPLPPFEFGPPAAERPVPAPLPPFEFGPRAVEPPEPSLGHEAGP